MSAEESILNELLAENQELRKQLQSTIEDVVIESLSSFRYEELKDKVKIWGILLAPGLWNGVQYVKKELKKLYDRFKDKLSKLPIKVEHGNDKEYKDKIVGRHTKVEWDDLLGSITYEGEITDKKAIEDIKAGRFRATSMKTKMIKRTLATGDVKGEELEPIDNSLTQFPACKTCVMFGYEELSDLNNSIQYYGIKEFIEKDISKENIDKEGDIMTEDIEQKTEDTKETVKEFVELSELTVTVFPEEEFEDEEVEPELMSLAEALKRKRVIYEYYPPGKYPRRRLRKKIKRRKGYYYYLPGYKYPVPAYYWYYYYLPYRYYYYLPYGYGSEGLPEELTEELELPKAPEKGQLIKRKVRNRWIVFQATGKKGFGAWKILGNFATEKEADALIAKMKGKGTEEKQERRECPEGQVWDEKANKCVPIKKEGEYPGKEEEKSMSEELAQKKTKCPVCDKEFASFAEFKRHWAETHEEKYGTYKQAKKLAKLLMENEKIGELILNPIIQELSEETSKEETKSETEEKETKVETQQEKTEDVKQVKEVEAPVETPKTETKEEPKEFDLKAYLESMTPENAARKAAEIFRILEKIEY